MVLSADAPLAKGPDYSLVCQHLMSINLGVVISFAFAM